MDTAVKDTLIEWAHRYNDPQYFQEDPIIFPTCFARKYEKGETSLADVEISALLASHLAWGRRSMIVRDCARMFDERDWRPYSYIMNGEYRDENVSMHRTIARHTATFSSFFMVVPPCLICFRLHYRITFYLTLCLIF